MMRVCGSVAMGQVSTRAPAAYPHCFCTVGVRADTMHKDENSLVLLLK